jgi:hypothetical protein
MIFFDAIFLDGGSQEAFAIGLFEVRSGPASTSKVKLRD